LDGFDTVGSPYYGQIVRCLAHQLHADGRNHRVYVGSNPDVSSNASVTDLTNDLKRGALSGLLLLDNNPDVTDILALAADRHIPVVSLASAGDVPLSVNIDRRGYLKAAAAHLMKLGHTRVAVIFNTLSCSDIRDARSIREALDEEVGLIVEHDWVIGRPAGFVGGYDAAQALPLGQIDGLIVTDDVMAMGVDRLLTQLSVRVPEELAVTTLWNPGSQLHPNLAFDRFEIDMEEISRSSIRLLNEASSDRRIAKPHLWSMPRLSSTTLGE
jgi:LacI family transcriptional regulator